MTGRRTATLRFRVTAAATLAVLAVLGAAGTALVLTQRATLTDQLDETLVDRALAVVGGPPADPARSEDVVTGQVALLHRLPGLQPARDRLGLIAQALVQAVGQDGAVRERDADPDGGQDGQDGEGRQRRDPEPEAAGEPAVHRSANR